MTTVGASANRPSPTIFGIQLLRAVAATAVVAAHVRYDFIEHLALPNALPRPLEFGAMPGSICSS